VFGKLMSAADRLMPAYLRALTELLDPQIDLLMQLSAYRKIHPMGVKTLLASHVTAAVHGIDQADAAHAGFTAQFSAKRFSDTPDRPAVTVTEHADSTVAELFAKVAQLVPSLGPGPVGRRGRRVAAGHRGARKGPGGSLQSGHGLVDAALVQASHARGN
jgi:tyrosyl-tRNA synthetase